MKLQDAIVRAQSIPVPLVHRTDIRAVVWRTGWEPGLLFVAVRSKDEDVELMRLLRKHRQRVYAASLLSNEGREADDWTYAVVPAKKLRGPFGCCTTHLLCGDGITRGSSLYAVEERGNLLKKVKNLRKKRNDVANQ